jgi:putative two-component system response regulator
MIELNTINKVTVLVVDDSPNNLALMSRLLNQYKVKIANSGVRCLQIARSDAPPDLILLDIMMPNMDGYEVCKQLKADPHTCDIPIIFLTAKAELADERQGFALGAADYITKPISPSILLARVKNHLSLKLVADFLRDHNHYLEEEVGRRVEEIAAIQDVTIHVVTSLAETRDSETGNHIRRTQLYVKELAEKLSLHPNYAAVLTESEIKLIYKSAPLHDIGKIGIPDAILLKPGRFTPEEFEIMKSHTTLGYQTIKQAEQLLGVNVGFLRIAKEITLSHQEKWDGSGYPQGLAGNEIPLSARLMAVADVYDALISRRVYKGEVQHEEALDIMREGRGTHFDPDILDVFMDNHEIMKSIAIMLTDTSED